MVLHLHPVKTISYSQGRSGWSCTYILSKQLARVKTNQDVLALTSCQNNKLESRQIKMVLNLLPVKTISQNQGRSRWSCTYILSKQLARVKADQDGLALTNCQNNQLESRQIKMVLHLPTVKTISQSQGRSRWSCTYPLSKQLAGVKADQDGLALTSCQNNQLESRKIKMVLHLLSVKTIGQSQGRSRWSCTYPLSKQ